jgi:hypothetical protein
MTWTYSGNPAGSSNDQIRFLIGDTETTRQLVSDEEIAWALTQETTPRRAAAICCDAIVAKFAKDVDSSTGSISRSGSQLQDQYRKLGIELRGRALVIPRAGGQSAAGKATLDSDTDGVQPAFKLGQDDYVEAADDE